MGSTITVLSGVAVKELRLLHYNATVEEIYQHCSNHWWENRMTSFRVTGMVSARLTGRISVRDTGRSGSEGGLGLLGEINHSGDLQSFVL